MDETNKILATATGMGASALWWFAQNENDRNDKFRALKLDQRDTQDRLNEHLSSGDWYRLTTPAVRDVISGFSTANAIRTAPTPIPSTLNQSRPDVTGGANIPTMSWPPIAASYNAAGNPEAFGELATAGQVFTFEEPRAWNQGLALARPPSPDTKLQIFYAAQGLVTTVAGLRLNLAQYQTAWTQLFTFAMQASSLNPHLDPSKPPTVSAVNGALASVMPLSSASIPSYNYSNPNTDTAMRFRVSVGSGGGLPALSAVFSVSFWTEYKWTRADGAVLPTQPVVIANGPFFFIDNITSSGFTVRNANNLVANASLDVFISVSAGVVTVG